jgi:uncharacterized protein (TIGR02453 family)
MQTEQTDWHFATDTRRFLATLRDNNRRDWFEAHRADYEAAFRAPGDACADLLAAELTSMIGRPFRPKVFRIFRDQRFARGAAPYRAHLHMLFEDAAPEGLAPRLFFGLEPDGTFVGGGRFSFTPEETARFRAAVASPRGEDLAALLADQAAEGASLPEPELKKPPRGFAADHPRVDLLRLKSFVLVRPKLPAEVAEAPGFVARCRAEFARVLPVMDWLRAVD